MWLVTIYQLLWSMWAAECTRCGGHHALSRCPWPAVEHERVAAQGCGGACNQGRSRCTCRKQ
jgi:hypothetical protein